MIPLSRGLFPDIFKRSAPQISKRLFSTKKPPSKPKPVKDSPTVERARRLGQHVKAPPKIELPRQQPPPGNDILTRVIRADQLKRKNVGITTTRVGERSLERNLPDWLSPTGKSKTLASGMYRFMRGYGGSGFQGFHKDLGARNEVVANILAKMMPKRPTKSKRGAKGTIVGVDREHVPSEQIHDLANPELRAQFEKAYPRFSKMYQRHADEGVVLVRGNVPRKSVVGMRSFRGKKNPQEVEEILRDVTTKHRRKRPQMPEPDTSDDDSSDDEEEE